MPEVSEEPKEQNKKADKRMTVSNWVWGDTGHKNVSWKYFSKTYEPLEPTNNTTMWESSGTMTSLREE